MADQDACPRCESRDTGSLPVANRNDRRCHDCGYEWPIYVHIRPGHHYADISLIVAQIAADVRAWVVQPREETS